MSKSVENKIDIETDNESLMDHPVIIHEIKIEHPPKIIK